MPSRKLTNPIDSELATIYRKEQSASSEKMGGHGGAITLTVVVILAVILTTLFSRKPESPSKNEDGEDTGLNVIARENTPGLTQGDGAFWYVVHLLDPSQWYYPTKEGFSRLNDFSQFNSYNDFAHFNEKGETKGMECLSQPNLPGYVLPRNPLPPPEATMTVLEPQLPQINVSDFLQLPVFIAEKTADDGKDTKVVTARWRRLGGGTLKKQPEFNEDENKLLEDKEIQKSLQKNDCCPTQLEVQFLPEVLAPRVLIRRSCGSHELDLAALKVLQKALDEQPKKELFNHLASIFLEVDWLM